MNNNKKIGRRLIELREDRSQQTVADALNFDRSTLAKLETGTRPISSEMLVKLAEYYKVSTDFILCMQGTERKRLSDIIRNSAMDSEDKTAAIEIIKETKTVICAAYCKHRVDPVNGAVPELCVGCPIRKL